MSIGSWASWGWTKHFLWINIMFWLQSCVKFVWITISKQGCFTWYYKMKTWTKHVLSFVNKTCILLIDRLSSLHEFLSDIYLKNAKNNLIFLPDKLIIFSFYWNLHHTYELKRIFIYFFVVLGQLPGEWWAKRKIHLMLKSFLSMKNLKSAVRLEDDSWRKIISILSTNRLKK